MAEGDDIERLIKRLKELQIEQADVIRRLEAAGRRHTSSVPIQLSPGDRVKIVTKVSPPDGVEASRLDTVGRVLSITPRRVKVKTDSGIVTLRAPHNIRKIQG